MSYAEDAQFTITPQAHSIAFQPKNDPTSLNANSVRAKPVAVDRKRAAQVVNESRNPFPKKQPAQEPTASPAEIGIGILMKFSLFACPWVYRAIASTFVDMVR